jgi:hypothetical protein
VIVAVRCEVDSGGRHALRIVRCGEPVTYPAR